MECFLPHYSEPKMYSATNPNMRYTPEEVCVFLKPPSPPETLPGLLVIDGAEMALSAVFGHYEGESDGHNKETRTHSNSPINPHPISNISLIRFKVNVSLRKSSQLNRLRNQ